MKESPTKMNKKGSFISKLKPYKNMGFDGDIETWVSMELGNFLLLNLVELTS